MSDLDRYLTEEMVEQAAHMVHRWMCECSWDDECRPHEGRCVRAAGIALAAAVPEIVQAAKAEAWEEGANTAWERSTPVVNGVSFYWRHEGEPANPYRAALIDPAEVAP